MWIAKLAVLSLVVGLALSQDSSDSVRRLRFRRPKPKAADADAAQQVAAARPTPADEPVEDLVAEAQQRPKPSSALESLLATAARDTHTPEVAVAAGPEPEAIPNAAPVRPAPRPLVAVAPAPAPVEQEEPVAPAAVEEESRQRDAPPVPRRTARPRTEEAEADKNTRRPAKPEQAPIGTVERYSHQNEDGSFTFGYVSEDGSFREETRGVDCITKGKYGYIDPEGKKREFTYVSGLPCDTKAEGETLNEDGSVKTEEELQQVADPIAPGERFRTEQVEQLSEEQIPEAAKRHRIPNRVRTEAGDAAAVANGEAALRDPALVNRRPAAAPAAAAEPALNSLLQVAGQQARPTPRPASPRTTAFNFDQEIDDFTLNKPALTFEGARPSAAAVAPATPAAPVTPVGPNFSSELVFNPNTGTFQTELRQSVTGQAGEVRITDPNAPAGRRPAPTPAPFSPTPVPTAAGRTPTAAAFSPTPIPTTARPFTAFASSSTPSSATGGLTFQPLSFPDPASVQVEATPRPVTPTATPTAASVTPTAAAAPAQTSFFFQPAPSTAAPATTAFPAASTTRLPPPPAAPTAAAPQVQFGFSPLSAAQPQPTPAAQPQFAGQPQQFTAQPQFAAQPQQFGAQRPAPFTAFAQGPPPQLRGVPPTQQQFAQPQQQFQAQPQQFGQPPQPQFGQPPQQFRQQQLGVPPQLQFQQQANPGRFPPQPQQQASPFTVFNPNQFSG